MTVAGGGHWALYAVLVAGWLVLAVCSWRLNVLEAQSRRVGFFRAVDAAGPTAPLASSRAALRDAEAEAAAAEDWAVWRLCWARALGRLDFARQAVGAAFQSQLDRHELAHDLAVRVTELATAHGARLPHPDDPACVLTAAGLGEVADSLGEAEHTGECLLEALYDLEDGAGAQRRIGLALAPQGLRERAEQATRRYFEVAPVAAPLRLPSGGPSARGGPDPQHCESLVYALVCAPGAPPSRQARAPLAA